ncbi:MAG: PIN domain-containing protein [Desulfobacteraceae bacterium]|nr:MAG: PIN domain-containing protein [Desulfobacteraceae bacterium]
MMEHKKRTPAQGSKVFAQENIFIDTSAFYALMDRSDRYHEFAKAQWPALLEDEIILQTSNYTVNETLTLLQYRLGSEAAMRWSRDVLAVMRVHWVNETLHRQAYELWLTLGRRNFSLVDCVSYITMHQNQIEKAFCFKNGYAQQGFKLVPESREYHFKVFPNAD